MNTLKYIAALCILSFAVTACEDAPTNPYVPQYVVEGFLFVNEPIQHIIVMKSQSVTDTFRYESSKVIDADVSIIVNGQTLKLQYKPDSSVGEYYLPDTSVKVLPNTLYAIEVRTPDGSVITGQTKTPGIVSWTKPPKPVLQYPDKDDSASLNNPPDSIGLGWTPVPDQSEYLLSVRSLDTIGYGIYLSPPTNDTNARIKNIISDRPRFYNDLTRWGFAPATDIPFTWIALKWYGKQEVSVYAADPAMVNWFKMTQWQQNASYDPLLANLKGGLGVFGSCSVARATVFVRKGKI